MYFWTLSYLLDKEALLKFGLAGQTPKAVF